MCRAKNKALAALVISVVLLLGCRQQREESEPDVGSSMKFNQDEDLTVVANRNSIANKEEFAKLLMDMFRDNSFHSVKFTTDYEDISSVTMCVYLWKGDIKGGDPVLTIEYKPDEWRVGYRIGSHPDSYHLYADGKLVEYP